MNPIKVCFLGTPDFAAVHLQSLLNNSDYKVVGVVSQPDRPAGRKLQLTASAVKVLALENNLPVITPENLKKEPAMLEMIKSWQADVAVVVAFGQILSQEFLDSFKFGAVNIHGSLLPLWRGAAPIQRSIEAGDKVTGVSLQRMVKKLDAGAVIGQKVIDINGEITASELYEKLSLLGCDLLQQELIRYVKGEIEAKVQDEQKVTLAPKIEKAEALVDWSWSAEKIHNRVRAFNMGPGTYVVFQGKRLKIHKTKIQEKNSVGAVNTVGTIFLLSVSELHIQTGQGVIALVEVQPESKSKISINEFIKSFGLHENGKFKKGDFFV